MKDYNVYILASRKNGTLYIGLTNNIERRMYEHKSKLKHRENIWSWAVNLSLVESNW